MATDSEVGQFIRDFYNATGKVDAVTVPLPDGSMKTIVQCTAGLAFMDNGSAIDWNNKVCAQNTANLPYGSKAEQITVFLQHPDPIYRTALNWTYDDNEQDQTIINITGVVPAHPDPAADIQLVSDYLPQDGDTPFAEQIIVQFHTDKPGDNRKVKSVLHREGRDAQTMVSQAVPPVDMVSKKTTRNTLPPSGATAAPPAVDPRDQKVLDFLDDYYQACSRAVVVRHDGADPKAVTDTLAPEASQFFAPNVHQSDRMGRNFYMGYSAKTQWLDNGDAKVIVKGSVGTLIDINGSAPTGAALYGDRFENDMVLTPSNDTFLITSFSEQSTGYFS